ncbi:MANSC domain-containing protein 1 [Tiliqua scincoides]|uniref:MANSC domain-containing protein 1 n=1 Tax=Tiliqua scincoides TaxID=71010 RepID=UPI003462E200
MLAHFAWDLACTLAVVLCAMLELSQGQDCSSEKMENITVDIRAALSKGIRGTDPVHTTSWEACVNVCCSGKEVADKKCNLVVFNARRKGNYSNYPNCYLFYYPSKEPFPVNQGIGLVTGRIITDANVLKPAPTSSKLYHFTVNEKSVPPPVRTPTKPPSWVGSLLKPSGSKMEENASHTEKSSFKTHGYSQHAKGEGANLSKSSDSSQMHDVSGLLSPNVSSTIKRIVSLLQPTVKLPPVTSGSQGSAVAVMTPSASPSKAATTISTAAYHRSTLAATEPRKSPAPPWLATTSGTSSDNLHLLPSTAPNIFVSGSLPDLPVTEMEPELAGSVSVGVSGEKHPPPFGSKNILLAALLFGVMFLLLVSVQTGRKILESLQQKHYTRLDYLLNGMYANM